MESFDRMVDAALERGEDPDAAFERIIAKRARRSEPDYSKLDIRVSAVFPPIPTNAFDYCAVDDATYDMDGPLGSGATRQEAIIALIERIAERDATDPLQILLELVHSKETPCNATNQPAC